MNTKTKALLNFIRCPRCDAQVHDRAVGCPKCGMSIYVEHPGDITPTKHPPLDHHAGDDFTIHHPEPNSMESREPVDSQAHNPRKVENGRSIFDQCVVAQYNSKDRFEIALEVLEKAGFASDEVSVIQHVSAIEGTRLASSSQPLRRTTPVKATIATSTIIGGVLGSALGAATTFGPLLIAGPLAGLLAGAMGGSLVSVINGWGVEGNVADTYEMELARGKRLIVVASSNKTRLNKAERSLKTTYHESVRRFSKASSG